MSADPKGKRMLPDIDLAEEPQEADPKLVAYVAFNIAALVILVLVLIPASREGIRVLMPASGSIGSYVMAAILVIATKFCLEAIILHRVDSEGAFHVFGWNIEQYRASLIPAAVLIVLIDFVTFFMGNSKLGWGRNGFNFLSLLGALVYLAVLVAIAYASARLKQRVLNDSQTPTEKE